MYVKYTSAVRYPPPERMDWLCLDITRRANSPHFTVDPGWPPRNLDRNVQLPVGSRELMAEAAISTQEGTPLYKEPISELRDRRRLKRREMIRDRIHLSVECPVCHAGAGDNCMLPLPHTHWERRLRARGIVLIPDWFDDNYQQEFL